MVSHKKEMKEGHSRQYFNPITNQKRAYLGTADGERLGKRLGSSDGEELGKPLGSELGCELGCKDGNALGLPVG